MSVDMISEKKRLMTDVPCRTITCRKKVRGGQRGGSRAPLTTSVLSLLRASVCVLCGARDVRPRERVEGASEYDTYEPARAKSRCSCWELLHGGAAAQAHRGGCTLACALERKMHVLSIVTIQPTTMPIVGSSMTETRATRIT